jgi:hypothetical protein
MTAASICRLAQILWTRPTRRAILARLAGDEATLMELA